MEQLFKRAKLILIKITIKDDQVNFLNHWISQLCLESSFLLRPFLRKVKNPKVQVFD